MIYPWQIYFYFIKKPYFFENVVETEWEADEIVPNLEKYFRDILWKSEKKDNFILYGDEKSTNIKVKELGKNQCEVMFILDLRQISEDFILKISEMAVYTDGVFLLENGEIKNPSAKSLTEIIKNSPAAKYCVEKEPYYIRLRGGFPPHKYFWES